MPKYIYESPDQGRTVYRREFGKSARRELVGNLSKKPRSSNLTQKVAVVFGGGGFIGSHLVKRLKKDGYWVRVVDLKLPEYSKSYADDYIIGDLRELDVVTKALAIDYGVDELYQLAADMGGAGFVFTGENDADIMHNSALINLNTLEACMRSAGAVRKIFYSSSACIYPEHNQLDPDNPNCEENSAYPAAPDSEYGWEKLFSERLYLSYLRNYGLDVRVGRFHNIFGPEGTWDGGREKAPAALCRKVAALGWEGGTIDVWGDGKQTRSFLYVDECVEAVLRLMESDFSGPVNIGSEEMISINDLVEMISDIADCPVAINHIDGPEGVRGRNSDNTLLQDKLGWSPSGKLEDGIRNTYSWITGQISERNRNS